MKDIPEPRLREVDAVLDPSSRRPEVFADLLLNVARKIEVLTGTEGGVGEMTHMETLVLRQIARRPGITPSVLGRQLGLKSSNTSLVLRALESRGLIARRGDDTDRRTVRIVATEAADLLIGQVSRYWQALLEPLITSDADLHAAISLLRTLDAALGD
jgi:DNA-binding MarR family transcriptional regulator